MAYANRLISLETRGGRTPAANPMRKHLDAAVKQVDTDRRRIKFVASQEILDRDSDVILVGGVDTSEFQRNPVLLGDHDRAFILGKALGLWVERRAGGDALIGEAEILPPGTSPRVDEAWGAIKFGARNGISIGFLPIEFDREPVRSGQRGVTFRRITLLEVSSVSLPACPTCLVEEKRWRAWGQAPPRAVVEIDEADFRAAYREVVSEIVTAEVRRQINLARGRVD